MRREHDQGSAGVNETGARQRSGQTSLWNDESDETTPGARPERFAAGTSEFDRLRVDDEGLPGDVVAIVHDLKNPLGTIALEALLLGKLLERGEGNDARGVLARIQHNVSFLDRLIQDILDSCAIEAGHLEVRRVPTDMRTLLEQVLDHVVSTRDRGRVVLDAPHPATITADELRIERVAANLVTNALKYAPPGTGIIVRLQTFTHAVRVSIIDEGTALTPEDLAVVFDKYRRASTGKAHQGSGLGLYVSRKIVEAHGGQIGAECAPGTGTRFFFDLPR